MYKNDDLPIHYTHFGNSSLLQMSLKKQKRNGNFGGDILAMNEKEGLNVILYFDYMLSFIDMHIIK